MYQVFIARYSYEKPEPWMHVATQEEAQQVVDAVNEGNHESLEKAFWEECPAQETPVVFTWFVERWIGYLNQEQWRAIIQAEESMTLGESYVYEPDLLSAPGSFRAEVGAPTAAKAIEYAKAILNEKPDVEPATLINNTDPEF